jgi:polar amino acid transport system substrate-binding protein
MMKTRKTVWMIAALALVGAMCGSALAADTLVEVKKKGVLIAGVKDSTPPFGSVDPATKEYVGYDIDFIRYIAKKLGVKAEFQPVTSANRMPMLMESRVDILAATMTKNPDRAKQIDFSYTYFLTGQKFLTKIGTVKSLKDLEGKKIGTAKGSTSEQNVKKSIPSATVLSFDDYPQGVLALQQGKVVAVTTDESILAGQLGKLEKNAATKGKFEIPDVQISEEPYGLGMRKGDANWVKFVNDAIQEMEKNGEAKKLFEKYFGPDTDSPMKRGSFKITADKRGIE